MSGIAEVLLTMGYCVSGSDIRRTAITKRLKGRGARVFYEHSPGNLAGADVVVVSSAIAADNVELAYAHKLGLPVVPRAEMLSELMRLKYGIAVAGTHGKTTTTSMIATVLTKAGLDPTMIIGGRVNCFRTNARLGKGDFLIAESDESDRSFLLLSPTIAVITNIDPEHMENYRDFEHVLETYANFANKVPFYGSIVICSEHPGTKAIMGRLHKRVITYGDGGQYQARDIRQHEGEMSFGVCHSDLPILGRVKLKLPGRHNVLNALAAIAVARELDIPFSKIAKGLNQFSGIERRFQILRKRPMVVSDYAHHPEEIKAVFKAAREGWPDKRIISVVQPHRYTRLANLFDGFVEVLREPDLTAVMPIYPAGERPIKGVTSEALVRALNATSNGRPILYLDDPRKAVEEIGKVVSPDDIVLFLGAGDIWKVGREFAKRAVSG